MAAARGPGFSEDETAALLDVIEDILPNCPNDWERVTEAHRISFPDLKRTTKSLKRKFEALYNHRKPTGDPTCPVSVRRAKQIWEDMRRAMDFSDAEGEISFDEDAPPPVGIAIAENPTLASSVAPAVSTPTVTQVVAPSVAPPVVAPAAVVATAALPAPTLAAPTAAQSMAATDPVYLETPLPSVLGQRLRTPRRNVLTGHPSLVQPSASTTSDLIQFMMMRAELEDKRRNEREEREERRARQREEAEERRRADEAEDRRERNAMMQMFMMGMMEGQRASKRRREDDSDNDRNS